MSFTNSLNLGSAPNDGTGEPLRGAFQKLINNDVFLKAVVDFLELQLAAAENDITDLETDVADLEASKISLQEVYGTLSVSENVVAASATLNVTNQRFIAASVGNNTINLPQSPSIGRTVEVYNYGGDCTINGESSMGLSNTFVLKGAGDSVICRYVRSAQGGEAQWAFYVGYRSTKGITEDTNLFFTNARARAAISKNSAELGYNSGTGVLTHTGLRVDKVTRPEGGANYIIQLTDMTVLFFSIANGSGTYTLPSAKPADGQVFEIIDVQRSASTAPLMISGNGRNIRGVNVDGPDVVLNQNGQSLRFKYFSEEDVYFII